MSKHLFPKEPHRYVYGPVPSRRLGRSLGIDLIPCKLCTYDCVYCQLGKTTQKSIRRRTTVDLKRFEQEVKASLMSNPVLDCISIAGSGEPTLSLDLDDCARIIKTHTDKPLVLITNGSLLYRREVRVSIQNFDVIVPSLDAVSPALFKAIDRPHPDIDATKVVRGLRAVRESFLNAFNLEIMLAKGFNDTHAEMERIARVVASIRPDTVQINLPARSPTSRSLMPSMVMVEQFSRILSQQGIPVQIVGKKPLLAAVDVKKTDSLYQEIVATLKRRPVTLHDLASVSGISSAKLANILKKISASGYLLLNNKGYYRIAQKEHTS